MTAIALIIHINNKTVFQNILIILVHKLQCINIINGGHVVELTVDRDALLLFVVTRAGGPFAKLLCNCLMIALASLIRC